MNIFVAPESCSKLEIVKYPQVKNPKKPQSYLYDDENLALYEVVKFSDQYRSWFVDNLLCREGHMNFLTRVNPLFVFLPYLMEFARDQFRSIHDICQTFASANQNFSRLDFALSPTIDWTKVCDTRDVDDEVFVRFSESKTLDWLLAKHKQTVAVLTESSGANKTSRANLILEASDLIEQYLPAGLADKFKASVRKEAISAGTTSNGSGAPSGGMKRTANIASADRQTASRQKSATPSKPPLQTPPKAGGIMNFFKPMKKQ